MVTTHMKTQHSTPTHHPTSTPAPLPFSESSPDYIVSFDGAMEPNGHPSGLGAWGFVVQDSKGKIIRRESGLMPVGSCLSNNVAEYTALLKAIEWVLHNLPNDAAILFQGDSKVVIYNVRGVWGWNPKKTKCHPHKRAPHLIEWFNDVVKKLSKFRPLATPFLSQPSSSTNPLPNNLPVIWVPGEDNPADPVSREPYDKAGITYRRR